MTRTEEILQHAESLPVEDRAFVVDSLLRSLNQTSPEIDRKWTELAAQRLNGLRSGEAKPISSSAAIAQARGRLAQ